MTEQAKDPLHILLFSALYPHAGEPTLGIFVENRLRHLIKDEPVKATVVAPVPWFPFKHRIFGKYARAAQAKMIDEKDGFTVYHPRYLVIPKIGMLLTPYFLAWSAIRCIRKLRRAGVKFDLIDAHYLYPDGVAAARLSAVFGVPWVVTARGSDVTQIAVMPRPRQMIVRALKTAGHVITVSQSLKNRLVDYGVAKNRISALRNGVDCEKFRPDPSARERLCKEAGFDPAKPILLFAGLLIPRKRVHILLSALPNIADAQVATVGSGPLQSALETQARELGVRERVAFLGQKTPDEMPGYFPAADILVLPSEREGWANVLLEAMACGTPVVASAVDGACELVTDPRAGLLAESDAPEDYASAINKLLTAGPARADVRAYAEQFGWEAISAGQMTIFRNALAPVQE